MNRISRTGIEMMLFQEELAEVYGYKPVPINLYLGDVRQKYLETLPDWCSIDGEKRPLYTENGTMFSSGYKRIVIGDYGAFIEISPEQIEKDVFIVKPGQEYRTREDGQFARVKYIWLIPTDKSECKVYLQKHTVDYADYKPGMYYISPYHCFPSADDSEK